MTESAKRRVLLLAGWVLAIVVTGVIAYCAGHAGKSHETAAQVATTSTSPRSAAPEPLSANEQFERRYNVHIPNPTPPASEPNAADVVDSKTQRPDLSSPGVLTLKFRAISLNRTTDDPLANHTIAHEVLEQIQKSSLFEERIAFTGKLGDEEEPGTFTFTIAANLKKPLKL